MKPSSPNGLTVRQTTSLDALLQTALKPAQPTPFWEQQRPHDEGPKLTPQQRQAAQLVNEGAILVRFRQFEASANVFLKAVSLWPSNAEIHYHAGCSLLEIGQSAMALQQFDLAIGLRPNWGDPHNNRSAALARMGRIEESIAAAERSIACKPNSASWANLCAAYAGQGENEKALAAGEEALRISQGKDPMALVNYGVALRSAWRLDEAVGAQLAAIKLAPAHYMAYANLGAIKNLQGRLHDAVAATEEAVRLNPGNATLVSNLIMYCDLLPETSLIEAYSRRRHWAYTYEAPLKRYWRPHVRDRDPDRPLRVGYVGADFRQHSAAHIHGPILRNHDPAQAAVYVYAGNKNEDRITALMKQGPAITAWRCTAAMSDHDVAELIRQDEIDILVDVAGFTAGGRLLAFAEKPAPIQVCAWGYANGTGLDAMDAFIADEVLVPPHLEHGYREAIVRLPNLLTFDPFVELPEPAPPPRAQNGFTTFGSFNRVEKITPQIFGLWCEVLKAVPDSRMVLKFGGLQGTTAENLWASFKAQGVEPERVDILGHTPRPEHLAAYGGIDVMLDTYPHVGGVTTLESLWMGVPCVTLLGERAPSRVSGSILTTLNMGEWVADSPEQYVGIAVRQAGEDLSALRAGLPARIRASVIGDCAAYTRAVEVAYRELWRRYLQQTVPVVEEGAA